jgi:hypothetical protein
MYEWLAFAGIVAALWAAPFLIWLMMKRHGG